MEENGGEGLKLKKYYIIDGIGETRGRAGEDEKYKMDGVESEEIHDRKGRKNCEEKGDEMKEIEGIMKDGKIKTREQQRIGLKVKR